MRQVITLVLASLMLVACVGQATHPGPTGPGTAWPCGYTAHSCGNGACCWNDSVCGGADGTGMGCPAGQCCYVGDEMAARRAPYVQVDEPDMAAGRVAR